MPFPWWILVWVAAVGAFGLVTAKLISWRFDRKYPHLSSKAMKDAAHPSNTAQ